MSAAATALLFKLDAFDHHPAIHRFAHIVDRQSSNTRGRERFHLHASPALDLRDHFDLHQRLRGEGKRQGHRGQRKRVAERDHVAGSLRPHNARQAGDFEYIPFGHPAIADQGQRLRCHAHQSTGSGHALRLRFAAGIDHPAAALLIEMGQFAHGSR